MPVITKICGTQMHPIIVSPIGCLSVFGKAESWVVPCGKTFWDRLSAIFILGMPLLIAV